uniref:Uncharacterized protein n=1 Tax=Pseudomonas phage Drael01 TaxID=3138533 RepID=A0AAU6W2D9_9VIRU
MQSYAITLQLSLKAVIHDKFLQEARAEAVAPDASLFLRTMQAKFPEDDDQFMLAVLKNAMRTTVRRGTLDFMARSGVGGSVSPVQVVAEEITQRRDAVVTFANAEYTGKDTDINVPLEQVRIDKNTPGVLVAGLIEDRAE